jgi:uracil DNA glycosylase
VPSRFDSLVHESWIEFLENDEELLVEIGLKLREEISHRYRYAPSNENIFRALQMPIDEVKVLIVG